MIDIEGKRWKKTGLMLATAVLSFAFALLVGAVIIWATGSDPLHTYSIMLRGAFGTKANLSESLVKASTLLLTGLSYAFVVKCGLINIGAEGQLYMGAAASTVVGIYCGFLPGPLHLAAAVLAGFAGGAVWGGIVGFLKARFNANEIITSLMLNYIAISFISYLVSNPIKDRSQTFPYSYAISSNAKLPVILPGTRLHAGLLIAAVCLVFYWFFYRYTARGYRMSVIGQNQTCALYAGFKVNKNMFVAMLLGGGFAGLGGSLEILGVQHRLFENFSVGYGFDGIAAALLANCSPLGMAFTSFLFGALKNGGNAIQMFTKVPNTLVDIVQSVVIIVVIMRVFSQLPRRRKKPPPSAPGPSTKGPTAGGGKAEEAVV